MQSVMFTLSVNKNYSGVSSKIQEDAISIQLLSYKALTDLKKKKMTKITQKEF